MYAPHSPCLLVPTPCCALHSHSPALYAAKYASAFYGPFRDALQSAPVAGQTGRYIPPHKKEYQVRFEFVCGGGGVVGVSVLMLGSGSYIPQHKKGYQVQHPPSNHERERQTSSNSSSGSNSSSSSSSKRAIAGFSMLLVGHPPTTQEGAPGGVESGGGGGVE